MFAGSKPDFAAAHFLGADTALHSANRPRPATHATAVAFDGCLGQLHAAAGDCGIVLCGAWGYEELILRASWRRLAERLAHAGMPCLRFDYPATGDSLGDPATVTFEDWIAATRRACDMLRATGVSEIVLAGHGLGALVACAAAPLVAASGIVLMAPATGRRYLRKTAHWAAMVASAEGVPDADGDRLRIAGFAMPPNIRAHLQAMGTTPFATKPAPRALLVEAPEEQDAGFCDHLTKAAVAVERVAFAGLDALLSGPTTAKTPSRTYDAVVGTLAARFGSGRSRKPAPAATEPPRLTHEDFGEEAVRFGRDNALFGVLCTPRTAQEAPVVVFANTGRNAHTGWRRMTVDHARALAAAGIASLRFDTNGIGDSTDDPRRPPPTLFGEEQIGDARMALDLLTTRGFTQFTIVGMCSGAYVALLTAVADPRIGGMVAINLPRFAWGPNESIEDAIRFANRPADHTLRRLASVATMRLIVTGRLDPRGAIAFRLRNILRTASMKIAPVLGRLGAGGSVYRQAHARLNALLVRGATVFLGYSATDSGLAELQLLFGRTERLKALHPTLDIGTVSGADHNLSQDHASLWMLARIKDVVAHQRRRAA